MKVFREDCHVLVLILVSGGVLAQARRCSSGPLGVRRGAEFAGAGLSGRRGGRSVPRGQSGKPF